MIEELEKGNLRPYPDYRVAGIPHLEQVPRHWGVPCLGQIGTLAKGMGGNKDDERPEGLPCVRYGDLYTTHKNFIERTRSFIDPEDHDKYTRIRPGDVLFAASGETIEEIGKSAVNLIEGPAYCGGDIILFRPSSPLIPRYMGYAMDCKPIADQKAVMGRGFTVYHIYGRQLKYLRFPIPPPDEQDALVRFLDHADEQIQRYIAGKERLIALLEEERQALVHQAVTRGLDPSVRLKPSPGAVEWLSTRVTSPKKVGTIGMAKVVKTNASARGNRVRQDFILTVSSPPKNAFIFSWTWAFVPNSLAVTSSLAQSQTVRRHLGCRPVRHQPQLQVRGEIAASCSSGAIVPNHYQRSRMP